MSSRTLLFASRTLLFASRTLLLLCALAVLQPAVATAQERTAVDLDVIVVVNQMGSVERLKISDLAAIYLGRKSSWDSGRRISPALPVESDSLVQGFVLSLIHI